MTSRELRNQRREAERKPRKLAYQQSRAGSVNAPELCGAGSRAGEPVAGPALSTAERSSSAFTPNPDLFDEFSAEEQIAMMAIRARVHARAGVSEPALSTKTGPTGPRTSDGKTISSGNSLKHGLASGRLIIPGEDPAEFEALLQNLVAEHAPATTSEQLLVQQMAQSWWLMQRAIRIQNEAFTETCLDTYKLALFLRYQTTYERAFYKALNALSKLKLSRAREQAVSLRRNSASEFVSQNRCVNPQQEEFVSQNRRINPPRREFVSQKFAPEVSASASGAAITRPRPQRPFPPV